MNQRDHLLKITWEKLGFASSEYALRKKKEKKKYLIGCFHLFVVQYSLCHKLSYTAWTLSRCFSVKSCTFI